MTFILPEADGLSKAMKPFETLWFFDILKTNPLIADPLKMMEAASDLQVSLFKTTIAHWLAPFSVAAKPETPSVQNPAPARLSARPAPQAIASPAQVVQLKPKPAPAQAAPVPVPGLAVVPPTDAPKLFLKPEGNPDDLQRIVGIGPKLSKLLNDIGIWHFRQIAAWTPKEVSWVNDKIAFKGRIEREGWQKQASRLAKTTGQAA